MYVGTTFKEQDDMLDDLHDQVIKMKMMSADFGSVASKQNTKLSKLSHDLEKTEKGMKEVNEKLGKMTK